jgi:hypothetical protein
LQVTSALVSWSAAVLCRFYSKNPAVAFWIFDAVLHFDQKSDGFFSVDRAVIVAEEQDTSLGELPLFHPTQLVAA